VVARLDGGIGTGEAFGDSFVSIENLRGSYWSDSLIGSHEANEIVGGYGDDTMWGLRGTDVLEGGAGDDMMYGGLDADTFIFDVGSGSDEIADFEYGVDTLELNSDLWNGMDLMALHVINNFTSFVDGNTVFSFYGGEEIILSGVTQLQLLNDIEIV
jgi:Ca2+-binding RTX toxin-like protein